MPGILITGGTGVLGTELRKVFSRADTPDRSDLDITKPKAVERYVAGKEPDILIHLAAITNVQYCEKHKKQAWTTNVDGTYNLVRAVLACNPGCYFVYMSTPAVFSGETGNYTESSTPDPANYYGLTKLIAENTVRSSGLGNYMIVRGNFVARAKWPYQRAFTDRYGTYLFADDLANALKEVISKRPKGIVHICGDRRASMFDIARITTPGIKPMTLAEYKGTPINADMSLKSIRIKPFKLTKR